MPTAKIRNDSPISRLRNDTPTLRSRQESVNTLGSILNGTPIGLLLALTYANSFNVMTSGDYPTFVRIRND